MANIIGSLHNSFVFQRRIQVLSNEVASMMTDVKTVLDIGCGDGSMSKLVEQKKGNKVKFKGIDVMARPICEVDFKLFDGHTIPFDDNSFDACSLIDVLHHLRHIKELVTEAKRVASKYIIIKDHLYNSSLDFSILKFMDWIGNKPHEVEVIYNYKNEEFWKKLFDELGLEIIVFNKQIPLYPFPFSYVFGRGLHFLALLKIKN